MPDLWEDFPDLAPSATVRVVDALESRGLVTRSGDPSRIYLGGVEFRAMPRALEGETEILDRVVQWLADEWELRAFAVRDRGCVTVLVPVSAVLDQIVDRQGPMTLERVRDAIRAGRFTRVRVSTELSVDGGQTALQVEVTPRERPQAERHGEAEAT